MEDKLFIAGVVCKDCGNHWNLVDTEADAVNAIRNATCSECGGDDIILLDKAITPAMLKKAQRLTVDENDVPLVKYVCGTCNRPYWLVEEYEETPCPYCNKAASEAENVMGIKEDKYIRVIEKLVGLLETKITGEKENAERG
jgi:predicted nucleic acid-binding Zn ribbon protein